MGERKRERCHSGGFPFGPSNGSFLVVAPHPPLSIHYKGRLHSFWEDVVKNLRIHQQGLALFIVDFHRKKCQFPGVVKHTSNPSAWEAKAGGLRHQGQPGLCSKIMSLKIAIISHTIIKSKLKTIQTFSMQFYSQVLMCPAHDIFQVKKPGPKESWQLFCLRSCGPGSRKTWQGGRAVA